ncbi:6874_t:CDS:2 [Gigaspora margarita]|uniref:6874_t:CDS:1 n=1 Tax=Gigaspora margarita TaxID=4874 RepID=A0ABN7VAB3_GIGMA|nr:6874_t:CDS:2 [Gigaspora margarita]
MLLLSSFPKNENNNYPLLDLSTSCIPNSSSSIVNSSESSHSTLMDGSCPIEPAPLIPVQIDDRLSDHLTLSICYDPNFESTNQVEWYSFLDFGTLDVEVVEFASDADDAGYTYLQESDAQPDPRDYIAKALGTASSPISDLFDYFYEERQDPYQIGRLEPKQHFRLQQFIDAIVPSQFNAKQIKDLRVLKKEEIQAILFSLHDDPLAGHFGFEAT